MAALEDLVLAENTVVIFTADHGGFVGNHRLADKGPAMYDDIYRIPLIVRDPRTDNAGARSQSMVSLLDITPTVLEVAGATPPDDVLLDGASFLPHVHNVNTQPRTWVTAEFHGHHFPYPQRMIRTVRYKLVVNPADINELYDTVDDPYELNNLYDHPTVVDVQRQLLGMLYAYLVRQGDNFHHWMPTMYDFDIEPATESATDQALVR
jgi:arylsulfatase A-like enzyme